MCSIGAVLHGVKSSSMCKATMLDNVTSANKIVHHSVGGSIATALRDHRQSSVIPIQPNRSLPVHPAPHHSRCRSNIAKVSSSSSSSSSSSLTRTAGDLIATDQSKQKNNRQWTLDNEKSGIVIPGNEISNLVIEGSKSFENNNEAEGISMNSDVEQSKIDKIENELIDGLEKLDKRSHNDDSNWRLRMMMNRGSSTIDSSEDGLIDITQSPENIVDLCGELGNDNHFVSGNIIETNSTGCFLRETRNTKKKQKRCKSLKKNIDFGNDEDDRSGNFEQSKTVPPLRLKKIQCLIDKDSFIDLPWRHTHSRQNNQQSHFINQDLNKATNLHDFRNFGHFGISNKYRIVTGDTPPYDESMDCSTLREPTIESLDAAKLKYKKSKLIVKLGQLRRKTDQLGNEMLRTVISSSNGSHAKKELQIRQKLNRYKQQIGNLERMLTELPEVTSYVEEHSNMDCQIYKSSLRQDSPQDLQNLFSSSKIISSSNSSSRRSSPSLEPPKLSPKFPTNYESSRSPSEVRNSPPILPPAYVTVTTDCTDDSWDGKNNVPTRRKGRLKRKKSLDRKKRLEDHAGFDESPIIINEKAMNDPIDVFHLDNANDLIDQSNLNSETIVEFDEKDLDVGSMNCLDVLEVYEESKNEIEIKNSVENIDIVETLLENKSSSPTIDTIDKTSLESEESKTIELRVIEEARVTVDPIDSFDEIVDKKEEKNNEANEDGINLREENMKTINVSGIHICERFPTLGNWIATLSKKQIIDNNEKLSEVPVVVEPSSTFQVIASEAVKSTTEEIQETSVSASSLNENPAMPQWGNDQWREQSQQQPQPQQQQHQPQQQQQQQQQQQPQQQQEQQQQQPLLQPYDTSNVQLSHPQPAASVRQDVNSPIANLAGFYARNYLDQCSMAYAYNPTIAAAASLWNSAAILQYPLIRPTAAGLLNTHQPSRISSSTNHQYPANGIAQKSAHRMRQHQNETKRLKLDNTLNYAQRDSAIKLNANGISKSFDYARRSTPEYQRVLTPGQSTRVSPNSLNPQTVDYRILLQQQQQQQQQQRQEQRHSQEQQQFARTNYPDSRFGVSGLPWRSSHLIGPMNPNYNYSASNGWSTNSSSLLNSRSSNSTPSFVAPSNLLSMNSSRSRISKTSLDYTFRNCNTPNLGKIISNPNAVNNYACSNCGLAGSMFKCLGCEVAFYCDENCQARHWNCHVKSCPKKMPKLKKVIP